jgi:hypothetical protein
LLGIEAPENFNAPFSASSPSDYWRRWHITLTLWLTDYVFTPLRLKTRAWGNAGLVFSLLVNMVLIGLWHGFRWNFALFGVVHTIYLSADALTARRRKKYYKAHPAADRAMNWLAPVLTFHLVATGLIFFRSDTAGEIFYFLSHIAQGLGAPSAEFHVFWRASGRSASIGFGAYFVMEALDYLRRKSMQGTVVAALPRWGRWAAYSCTATAALLAVCLLLASGAVHNPFMYAIF